MQAFTDGEAGGGGENIIMTIICSNQKCGTSRAAGKALGLQNLNTRAALHVSAQWAGYRERSVATYGFLTRTLLLMLYRCPHNRAHILSCTHTHMWNTFLLLMGSGDLTKSQLERDPLLKVTTKLRSFNPSLKLYPEYARSVCGWRGVYLWPEYPSRSTFGRVISRSSELAAGLFVATGFSNTQE